MKRIFILPAIFFLISCERSPETIHPKFESISESVYASGTITTADQYQVFPSAAGVIEKVFVKEGDAVKKGSLLAVLSGKVAEFNQEAAAIKAAFDSRASNESKLTDAKRLADLAFKK